jgi:hypothetical protein
MNETSQPVVSGLPAGAPTDRVRTSHRYNLVSAILAFLLWGGWAFLVNGQYGLTTRLVSGVTQGVASFVITLIMVRAVIWLYHQMPRNVLRVLLPPTITVSCSGSCLAMVHYLVGTPRIVQTITPALTVAFAFCLYTALKVFRADKTKD